MDCWKESRCVNCGYDFDNEVEISAHIEDPDCYKREQEENMLTDEQGETENGN